MSSRSEHCTIALALVLAATAAVMSAPQSYRDATRLVRWFVAVSSAPDVVADAGTTGEIDEMPLP
jgi:hypothetical protein